MQQICYFTSKSLRIISGLTNTTFCFLETWQTHFLLPSVHNTFFFFFFHYPTLLFPVDLFLKAPPSSAPLHVLSTPVAWIPLVDTSYTESTQWPESMKINETETMSRQERFTNHPLTEGSTEAGTSVSLQTQKGIHAILWCVFNGRMCVHACVHTQTCMCTYVHREARGQLQVSTSIASPLFFFLHTVSLTEPGAHWWTDEQPSSRDPFTSSMLELDAHH